MNRTTYNDIADQFSGTRDYLWDDLQELSKFIVPNSRVLDIGCGNGRLYQLAEKNQAKFVGVDQSEKLIEFAIEKFPKAEFVVSEMNFLPFKDNSFDLILAIASLHHIPSEEMRQKALEEMKRVITKKGTIILLNWNMFGDWVQNKVQKGDYNEFEPGEFIVPWRDGSKKNYGDRYYHGFTPEEIEKLCKKVGLTIQEQYFTKRGERSEGRDGDNIISIVQK